MPARHLLHTRQMRDSLTLARQPYWRNASLAGLQSALAAAAEIAIFRSYALGANYLVWAAMGVLAVLQGAHLHISMNRALQYMARTVVVALLVWVILDQNPSILAIFAILVGLQYATELIIGSNYALGQILITPMALLMTHLGAPDATGAAMVHERIMDFFLGAAIGMAIAILWSSLEERRQLARHAAQRRSPP